MTPLPPPPDEDLLQDAPLTIEQRRAWERARRDAASLRLRVHDLEARLATLECEAREEELLKAVLPRPDFNREVARVLALDERYGGTSSILYFDFDNFDEMGRAAAPAQMQALVRALTDAVLKNIRRSDIMGRLAPDEFGVLLARCDNANAWLKAEGLALEIKKSFDLLTSLGAWPLLPVVNFGAYTFREKEDLATGIKNAAAAMTN